ncbi:hypothetical protein HMPREF1567_0609 [Providencia alcalifaciens PAL-2]|nr:hypothetical protein HMPREF1567_0609 [Providencia alcalifaciens PAL-2]
MVCIFVAIGLFSLKRRWASLILIPTSALATLTSLFNDFGDKASLFAFCISQKKPSLYLHLFY